MVSMKNIAEKCGVSVATVSKVLNNHTDISMNTRNLVRRTAAELGYFPNSQARALKTNKTFSIGVLFVDKAGSGLKHSFFSLVLDSFKAEAEKQGYDIMFVNSRVGDSYMSYLEHCHYRNFDGVFVACVDFCSEDVEKLFKSDIPLVAVDYESSSKFSVMSDNRLGIQQLVNFAYERGHSKIAYICGDSSQVTSCRLSAFYDTMKSLGLEVNPGYVKQAKYHDVDLSEKIVCELIGLDEPPTCILLPDDFSAFGAFEAAEKAGLRIPDDISIAGYDGIYLSRIVRPRLTTISQNTLEIGRLSAELLIKAIENKEILKRSIMVSGAFIEGETVRNLTVI